MLEEDAQFLANDAGGSESEPSVEPAHPMEALLEQGYKVERLKKGEILEGTIVYISPDEILVDVGAKSEGIVVERELDRLDADFLSGLQVGDRVLTYVVVPEDKNGNILLSLAKAQMEKDWREAERLHKAQEVFEGIVAGYNKGGLIVRLGRVRGFVPTSQLTTLMGEDATSEEQKAKLMGKTLKLKVIELDRERNRLILSERAAVRDWRRRQKDRLLDEVREGDTRTGIVSSLCDFGAFVDLGEADGLVHMSEISWRRVAHPSEVLRVGQKVEAYVLSVDRDRRRIALSLKRLMPDPWKLAGDMYHVGQLVEGTVTKLVKFGAFARLAETDVEGLIHISELSDEHVSHPKEVVKEGDVLTLRIIKIDIARRRMGLSLKRVDLPEYAEQDWAASQNEATTPPRQKGQAAADKKSRPPEKDLASPNLELSEIGTVETVTG